ncbi:MAG TPA: pantetheine-phosphate adenylyltransferase, partial [Myxococcota bacterium]|nr:pantetheine-phosphate adenylyltransferase [Myxococcota bacterium]
GKALYPGSFDPVTCGHLDVIRRGTELFGDLVVAVGNNPARQALFTVEERLKLLRDVLADAKLPVEVVSFEGLVVDFARKIGARCLLRGVRNAGDFEYELSMAQMNRQLAPQVETVFVMPSLPYSFLSARLVRESGIFGAPLKGLVPDCIRAEVERRLVAARPRPSSPASPPSSKEK